MHSERGAISACRVADSDTVFALWATDKPEVPVEASLLWVVHVVRRSTALYLPLRVRGPIRGSCSEWIGAVCTLHIASAN